VLCDLGFKDVTISDFSDVALENAAKCDPILKIARIDASNICLPSGSYDVVAVQDGLHHLQDPVHGFTELLRVSREAAFFLEPHDSLSTLMFGRKWEQLEGTRNYVFRWTKKLVQDVASAYLVTDSFLNLSFSFWHHGDRHANWRKVVGNGTAACKAITALKVTLDRVAGRFGNQFCGMVLRAPD
jgi:ubiquinone/menaquinone biosynthesis C-methylase UbiE